MVLEWSPQFLETCLADISEETLARWYVDLNCWRWPRRVSCSLSASLCRGADPGRATGGGQGPLGLYPCAYPSAASKPRAWWLIALQRSEGAWDVFWRLPVSQLWVRHQDRASCQHGLPVAARTSLACTHGQLGASHDDRRVLGGSR